MVEESALCSSLKCGWRGFALSVAKRIKAFQIELRKSNDKAQEGLRFVQMMSAAVFKAEDIADSATCGLCTEIPSTMPQTL